MKTLAALAIAAATTLGMAGCQTYDHHDHYAAGAYIDG